MPTRNPPQSLNANPDLLMDLVAANRILAVEGVLDGYGHVRVRGDKHPDRFYMSRSVAPQLVKVNDIMEHDPDSEPVGDERRPYLERFLHGEIYRQRPDVMAIVHSHSPDVIPFSVTKSAMKPIYHMASFLFSGVPVYEIRKTRRDNDRLIRGSNPEGALHHFAPLGNRADLASFAAAVRIMLAVSNAAQREAA